MRLTPEQRAAATIDDPRVAIVAGAGAGKTAVLVARVKRLLDRGVDPGSILVCAFTVAAADELRERLVALDTSVSGRVVQITTMHGWAHDVLREFAPIFGLTQDFDVYDPVDAKAVRDEAATDLGRASGGSKRPLEVQALYDARLREANAVDYDAMLALGRRALAHEHTGPVVRRSTRHVLIDEAQDLDANQHGLAEDLSADELVMVGDPRQSLYRWRGAMPELFQRYAESAATAYLAENHRSLSPIVELANGVFRGSTWPPMSATRATDLDGVTPVTLVVDDAPDAIVGQIRALVVNGFSIDQIAVLGRTWKALAHARDELKHADIPCSFYGPDKSPWESEIGRTIARWCRLTLNPGDDNMTALVLRAVHGDLQVSDLRGEARDAKKSLLRLSVERTLLPEPGDRTLPTVAHADRLLELCPAWKDTRHAAWLTTRLSDPRRRTLRAFRRWWTLARTIQDASEFVTTPAVTLTTVHGAKGLAWRAVVLLRCDRDTYRGTPDRPTDDQNTLYVAVTRARDRLVVMRRATSYNYNVEAVPTEPPAYMPEIPC